MKMQAHWLRTFFAVLFTVICSMSARQALAAPVIYLAGDSTVMTYGSGSYPQQGWGGRLPA